MNSMRQFGLRFLMLFLLLGVFCSTGYAGNATAPFPSPYPGMVCGNADCSIRWAEELGLESLEEARDKLDSTFDFDCFTLRLTESYDVVIDSQDVCTCNNLVKYAILQYSTGPRHELERMIYVLYECIAIHYLTSVNPAKHDYISHFSLDIHSPNILSPRFGVLWGEEKRAIAEKQGKSWIEYDKDLQIEMDNETLKVTGDAYCSYLDEYARGDFDGDGLQDVLIKVSVDYIEGHGCEQRLFLVTKKSENEDIEITKMHEYYTRLNLQWGK